MAKFSVWCLALWNVRHGRPIQEKKTTNEMLVVDERKIGQVESELVVVSPQRAQWFMSEMYKAGDSMTLTNKKKKCSSAPW